VVPGSFAACSAPGTRTVPETGEESVRRPIVRRLAFQLGSRRAGTFPAFYSSVISMLGVGHDLRLSSAARTQDVSED
jgi:hypothetical protein